MELLGVLKLCAHIEFTKPHNTIERFLLETFVTTIKINKIKVVRQGVFVEHDFRGGGQIDILRNRGVLV